MSREMRSKINSQLAILGGLVVISGVFLFFHFESFLVKFTHEVAGPC